MVATATPGRSLPDRNALVVENLGLAHWQVKHFLRRYHCRHLADDLLGEAMLALIRAASDYDPGRGSFSNFATVVIRHRLQEALARLQDPPHCPLESWMDRSREPDPADTAAEADQALWLHQLVSRLPDRQRAVIEGRLRGLHGGQIAEEMRLSKQRVSVVEEQALAELRKLVGASSA